MLDETASSDPRAPLPRRKLKRWEVVLLAGLRVYVMIAIPVVAYAFWQALARG